MKNIHYHNLLKEIAELHDKKSHDYADDHNVFSNFEFAAKITEIFNDPVDKVFATLIGIKLARLAQLRNGKIPKNESLLDTGKDQVTYNAIWVSWMMNELEDNDVEKMPGNEKNETLEEATLRLERRYPGCHLCPHKLKSEHQYDEQRNRWFCNKCDCTWQSHPTK